MKHALFGLILSACTFQTGPLPALTPGGIEVTTGGNEVDLERVDTLVTETARCFGEGEPAALPPFVIVIPPPVRDHADAYGWYVSPCTGAQKFYCSVHGAGDPDLCATRCAGTSHWQYSPAIVTLTPDLGALSHELVHVYARTSDHTHALFKRCAGISRARP